jgi:hypothetical protein
MPVRERLHPKLVLAAVYCLQPQPNFASGQDPSMPVKLPNCGHPARWWGSRSSGLPHQPTSRPCCCNPRSRSRAAVAVFLSCSLLHRLQRKGRAGRSRACFGALLFRCLPIICLGSQTKFSLWGFKFSATCGARGMFRLNESTATTRDARVYCVLIRARTAATLGCVVVAGLRAAATLIASFTQRVNWAPNYNRLFLITNHSTP